MSQLTPDETLLGLLAANANYGYQLVQCFRDLEQMGDIWNLSTSQIYAVLKRLETQRLISGNAVPVPDAPVRIEYCLTEQGLKHLAAWLDADPSPSIRRVSVEFLSRLHIARLLNISTINIVRRQKIICQQRYNDLVIERDQAESGIRWLKKELEISKMGAILQWIDRCELVPHDTGDDPVS